MIVLDTNVMSAMMHADTPPHVVNWLDRQPFESFWTTTITLFEIRFGIERLPLGKRRRGFEDAFQRALRGIDQRIFSFDIAAAEHAALLDAKRHKLGRRVETRDTMIAGIALAQRARLATQNVKHFSDLDIPVINPWAVN